MPTLPLSDIVNVTYNLTPNAAPRGGFNTGLIMGNSSVISTTQRTVKYNSVQELLDAGFPAGSPEVLGAQLYYSAISTPRSLVVGRVGAGETPLAALQDARIKNQDWYWSYCPSAVNSDHQAIAAWVESLGTYSQYLLTSSDTAVLSNTSGNLFQTLRGLNYRRTQGFYTTFPNAGAGLMGYGMGANTDLNNSAYSLAYKRLPGVLVDSLTEQQTANLTVNRGNYYVNRNNYYDWYEFGTQFDGSYFDETLNLDKMANRITLNVADALYQMPKIPQTEPGMALLRTYVEAAMQPFVNTGFIAPGVWKGNVVGNLKPGTYLPKGYLVMSDPIDTQPQADRDARKAPPIYACAKLAGAIHFVTIAIPVNR